MNNQDLLGVSVHSPRIEASLTDSNANLQDYDDIVATQGAYLIPRPRTPVLQQASLDHFAITLRTSLEAAIEQGGRMAKYHDPADKWGQGYTPPEVEEKHNTTADDGSNNNNDAESKDKDKDKCGNDIDARFNSGKPVAALDQPRRQHWLFSLLASPECSVSAPHGRKRREISGKDDEEKERPAKRVQS
ncbi:hypothetical protein FHL15_008094 [Xylaria flabelliformis]|uniref:Uncharacterized protein n=1 Tax=Xylaria flabelliformis TaxID=2512241 RepID=A0A553HT29_9PEZI|nr:hypothetical protein FHL15_008094 [Xylaria flabelliformis]